MNDAQQVPAPPPPSTPYREPEPAVDPQPIVWPPAAAPRRPWPFLGPTLGVFAMMLWSFVIAGQLTTSWMGHGGPLDQNIAFGFVFVVTFAAWLMNVGASRAVAPTRTGAGLVVRAVAIGALAAVFFVVIFVAAAVAGNAGSHNHDVFVAFALVAVAVLAGIVGRRLTALPRPTRTQGRRLAVGLAWTGAILLTLIAGAELIANG